MNYILVCTECAPYIREAKWTKKQSFSILKKAKRQKQMTKIESEYGLWTTKDAHQEQQRKNTQEICILDMHLLTN